MRQFLFFILYLAMHTCVTAQTVAPFTVEFDLRYGNEPLSLEKYYALTKTDSFCITTFRFYISNIELQNRNETVYKENESYHLIDIQDKQTQKIHLSIPDGVAINTVYFNLGIDSVTNVAGVKGGDLDPMQGMYWTWQSGYINVKIEGKSNLSKGRNNAFEYHLGGYMEPFASVQKIYVPTSGNAVRVVIDVEKIFQAFDISACDHIMSPSVQSTRLSVLISTLITAQ